MTSIHKFLLPVICIVFAIFVALIQAPSYASKSGNHIVYCNAHFYKPSAIYYKANGNITKKTRKISWQRIEKMTISRLLSVMLDTYVDVPLVRATKSVSKTLRKDPDALFVELIYSYVPANVVSTPLEKDALAIWIKTHRIIKDQDTSQGKLNTLRSRYELYDMRYGSQPYDTTFHSGPTDLIMETACKIIENSTQYMCSKDPTLLVSSKVIRKKTSCIPGTTPNYKERHEALKKEKEDKDGRN